jgi:L-aspartate oxidase
MTPSVSDYKSKTEWEAEADVVVVGSGVAGLTAALRAAELGLRVLVVTKGRVTDGNTRWAQGGVAAVLDDGRTDHGRNDVGSIDSIDAHVADTLRAGAGLCDPDVVRTVVASGAAAVKRLRSWGARFDIDDEGRLARTREGGHSAFRVIHAGGDATGAEVQRCLVATARREGLTVLEQHIAVAALTTETGAVRGVRVLATDVEPAASGIVRAGAVVLATGGHGQLYQATPIPSSPRGTGWRWPGARGPARPIWSSCSSIPRCSTPPGRGAAVR